MADGAAPGPAGKRPEGEGGELDYLDVGWQMLGALVAGVLGGWLVARRIHADWPLAVGGMVGIAVGLYQLVLMASNKTRSKR